MLFRTLTALVCFTAVGMTQPWQQGVFAPHNGQLSQAVLLPIGDTDIRHEFEKNTFRVSELEAAGVLSFLDGPDGSRYGLLKVEAPAANAVRVHFQDFSLPENAFVMIYAVDDQGRPSAIAGPYKESGPTRTNEFWSDSIPGSTAYIEYHFSGEPPSALPFLIDRIQQLETLKEQSLTAIPEKATRHSVYRGAVVEHEIIEGEGVLEGDILMGPAELLEAAREESSKSNRNQAVGIKDPIYRWPGGVIPYTIDSALQNDPDLLGAIAHWNTKMVGVIKLVPRKSEFAYIRFRSSTSCSSYVGRIGVPQDIKIAPACSFGSIVHEIGHAVGLYHEQSRADRDNWIDLNTANINLSSFSNFLQYLFTSQDFIYYGYNSIMHYSSNSFSNNGQPTIQTVPAGIPIGQRAGLDISDIAAVRQMYGAKGNVVYISTVPEGLTVYVDGVSTPTPAKFNWAPGSVHSVKVSGTAVHSKTNYAFVRWSDKGAMAHNVVVPVGTLALAATFASKGAVATSSTTTSTAASTSAGMSDWTPELGDEITYPVGLGFGDDAPGLGDSEAQSFDSGISARQQSFE